MGEYKPHEVTPEIAEKLIEDVKGSETNQTKKQYLKYVRLFFNWCISRKYISENPTKNIKVTLFPDEVKIYEPEDVERLLRLCEEKFPSLLGYYCLTIFGGLRPSEAQRMEWKDLSFDTKQVSVNKWGKVGARKFTLKSTDTLWVWLAHIKAKNPDKPLNPLKGHAKLQRKCREAFCEAGETREAVKWVQDGLRHSFGTYYYNLTRNILETVFVMGNSEKIARKHYLQAVTEENTKKYWALRPAT